MRVLITGSSGFLGGHVTERIADKGCDVLALKREDLEPSLEADRVAVLCGDLADLDSLKSGIAAFDPEVVVHLAWEGIPDFSERVSRINLFNSMQLFDFVAEETGCRRVVAAGSCLEYGREAGACVESDAVELRSYFAWAKYSLYRYLALKCDQGNLDLIWFRIFYAYGPGQRSGSLIPTLAEALRQGRTPDIRSPSSKNDFVYVEDIAEAFSQAIEVRACSGVYNLGSGTATSVHKVCRTTEECILGEGTISDALLRDREQQGIMSFWASTDKLAKAFGWSPKTTLEEGIGRYVETLH
jgi:UDP-glucose 4-epimerase